jgi:hypothetical protein
MKDLPGLHLKRPAPGREPRLTAMIDGIRAAGAVCRTFAAPREAFIPNTVGTRFEL